jgi:hypothetical protein
MFFIAFSVILSEALAISNKFQALGVNKLFSVGFNEALTVFVSLEVEFKSPYSPENIDVPISDTSVSEVDEA